MIAINHGSVVKSKSEYLDIYPFKEKEGFC